MKNKSIVFLQITGGKSSTGTGGGLVFQELLARMLLQRGWSVYAITNSSDLYGFSFLGEKRFSVNSGSDKSGIYGFFMFNRKKLASQLSEFVSKIPLEAIYVTVDPFPKDIFAARFLLYTFRKKVIVTMHHITPSPLFHPIRRGVIRSVVAWLISVNALLFVKLNLVPVFLDNQRIAKRTGWHLEGLLMEIPLSLGKYVLIKPTDLKNVACFVGRLAASKGVADLISAWKIVVGKLPDAKLILIGRDYGNGKYQKLIRKLSLGSNIVIMGYVQENEKRKLLESASLFTFPSYEEGWALSVMEAVNLGLLPILYDLPAYDYLCSREIKVRPGDIQSFADVVLYYFEHRDESRSLVDQLQNCIGKFTDEYVLSKWVDQISEHYPD
ncbi:MAG: glycosyltransferase family 4 protein [Thermoplasmataceae archaeon]